MERTKKINKYAAYLRMAELSEGTVEIYVREAMRLREFLGSKKISKTTMIEYKNYLGRSGYAPATQNLYITAANRYLRYLGHEESAIKTNRLQSRQSLEDIITKEEYREMILYARESGREKYYAILRTLAMTGIRVSELQYFTAEALNKGVIRVTNKKKTREICLPEKLIRELRAYCEKAEIESGTIFRGNAGRPISRVAVYKMLRKMADMVGVSAEKAHPHGFRHLFAVTYMAFYSNLFELADLLGHSSLETTRVYARSTLKEKGQRINMLDL